MSFNGTNFIQLDNYVRKVAKATSIDYVLDKDLKIHESHHHSFKGHSFQTVVEDCSALMLFIMANSAPDQMSLIECEQLPYKAMGIFKHAYQSNQLAN
jgi:hypothetical protein